MHEIYLYPEEVEAFNSLSDELKEGWSVLAEEGSFEDTAEHLLLRLESAKLYDPVLIDFREQAAKLQSLEEFDAFLDEFNFKNVTETDFPDLLFALGPDAITYMIKTELGQADEDRCIEQVASLSVIRHHLLESLAPLAT